MKPKKKLNFSIPVWWPDWPGSWRTWIPSRGNTLFTLIVVAGLLWAQSAGALPQSLTSNLQSPSSTGTIAYQGRLADSAGTPITDTVNMEFRLYDVAEGGTPLWSELWTGSNAVRVSDGLFNVMLGSLEPIPQDVVAGHDQLYLGITVGTDDEMSPRVQLGSVPFAVQALTVPDGSVTTAKIADRAVTKTKLDLTNGLTVRGPTNNKALHILTDYESRFKDQVTISSQLDSGYGIAFTGQNAHRGGIYAENIGGPDYGEGRVTIWARKNGDIILDGGKIGVGTGSPNAQLDVDGDFQASGTKSSVIDASTFGQRKLYAAESPEVRFFDEGVAYLKDGRAKIFLDPVFLEAVEGDFVIHVTPYGDVRLYVADRGEDFFVVQARDHDSEVAFAWRLSAYRKGYAGIRLEQVEE